MFQKITKHRRWKLTVSILSLSLLTVMAGAAVAPALNLIAGYFRDTDPMFVQMIISMPALFIALTNLFFQKLTKRFRARTLLMIGLALYVIGGCIAGIFSNIFLILICRAVVGIGVGIIMPLSTGLISFYFTRDKQDVLMGSFFIYPANFAIETARQAVIDQRYVAVIMAMMDVFGFFGGLAYVHLRKGLGNATKFLAPVLFFAGYALLQLFPGWIGTLAGSFLVGFANGVGVPLIISTASKREGSRAAATVIPLISMALYLAQFTTPFIAGSICALLQNVIPGFSSYSVGMTAAVCFLLWSFTIPVSSEPDHKPSVRQEAG